MYFSLGVSVCLIIDCTMGLNLMIQPMSHVQSMYSNQLFLFYIGQCTKHRSEDSIIIINIITLPSNECVLLDILP